MKRTSGSSKKPLWTEEFSVHGAEDKYVLRRQFTKFLVLTSFGMFVGNVWIYLRSVFGRPPSEYPHVEVARVSEVADDGIRLFRYPTDADPCILVRMPSGEFVAYSQKCTHLACAVYYSRQHNRLECPCHEGYFSIETGRVLQGPPPRPLPRIQLERRGDIIYAIGVAPSPEGA